MKLEKAIEYLELERKGLMDYGDPNWDKAVKLGNEALKYRLELEQEDPDITLEPLPGETE